MDSRIKKKRGLLAIFLVFFSMLLWAQNWDLVWSDEFDGEELDESKWSYMLGTGTSEGLTDWGNNEEQYYRKENVVVADGLMTISAKEEEYEGKNYTSGRIRTKNKVDWTFGRFEVRAKMPVGKGLWAASWMMPTDVEYGGWAASGEIDMVEYLGDDLKTVHGTLHFGGNWPNNASKGKSYQLTTETFSEEFHDFAMEWTEGKFHWYVDDKLYQVQTQGDWWSSGGSSPAPFDKRFHYLFNLAVGGYWPGSPNDNTVFPQEFVIDYIRVYELNTTAIESETASRGTYSLEQNFPNPFGQHTRILFTMAEAGQVTLEVFDALGRRVETLVDEVKEVGRHQVELDGSKFPPGLYSYRLITGSFSGIKQMVLL
jgi:beta-glucanase (GH16 family)